MPYINNESLLFLEWDIKDRLIKSKYNTFEPHHNNLKVCCPQILFIPLLAYDRFFNRLGYGGGFYDKVIYKFRRYATEKKKSFLAVGISYDKQEIQNVPIDAHDQKLDIIITEKKIIYRNETYIWEFYL